ncbi:cytochrome P450 [Aspergillus sclerotioniger CBS 115572]|uniref:Cytochrome P450 n=1 Tax=Aspergillus sclerotioniger CBS 115572 TaxID=1450535 RepID=A0A317X9H9_9EURO|nr:cytochrome P450 [Aspergillus sclerotioniger CBS 115572]PWY95015.1 cytochrome P450 [Aspergillus sclerotioniger CBS 115572]
MAGISLSSDVSSWYQTPLLLLLAWVTWSRFIWPNFCSPLRHLPSPNGGVWSLNQRLRLYTEPRGRPQCDWVNSIPNNGLIRYRTLLNSDRLLVTSPEAFAEVLTTKCYDFKKPRWLVNELKQVLGVGLLLAEGNEHQTQRKILAPAFSFRHIKNLYAVFWDKSREVVATMTDHLSSAEQLTAQRANRSTPVTTGILDIAEWASRATLDMIGIAGMGRDFGAVRDPNTGLMRAYSLVFHSSKRSIFLAILRLFFPGWLVDWLPLRRNKDIQDAARTIRGVCAELIRQESEHLRDSGALDNRNILSVALQNGGFSEDHLIDQLMTFLAAGHETTATAITWAIYSLCVHPGVQTTLRREIRERLPSPDNYASNFTSHNIDTMVHLNAVCDEVLRYFSPVPLTVREAAIDTTILAQPVPKGTKIMLVPRATNRDANLWGLDAREFNPDRWMASDDRSNYATMTFLHGPRSCIGRSFAKAQFAILLAALVGRFEFELKDEQLLDERNMKVTRSVTARPANGLLVKVTPLEGW